MVFHLPLRQTEGFLQSEWMGFSRNMGDYFGINSMEEAMAEAGKVEEWQAIVERFAPCVTKSSSSGMQYLIDASYAPSGV